jgi:hypothetical protein
VPDQLSFQIPCRGFSSSLSDTDKSIAIPFLAYTIFNALKIICIKLSVVSSTTTTTVMSGRGPLKFNREPFLFRIFIPMHVLPFLYSVRTFVALPSFYRIHLPFLSTLKKMKNISLSL